MRPRKQQFAIGPDVTNMPRCPVCGGYRATRRGVLVDHWPTPKTITANRGRRNPVPLCKGSGMKAGNVSGEADD